MEETKQLRHCQSCGKELYGRADQKFCNDTCRNNFNKTKARETRLAPHPNQKEIFRIISKNYDILRSLVPGKIRLDNHHSFLITHIPDGFNRSFYTSIVKSERGIWHLCFDRGWMEENDRIVIKDFPEHAIL